MELVSKTDALREKLADWRDEGEHIALVPTLGNLHDGHLSLASLAREHAERVVVSIFVNPSQFAEGEDFDSYPRTLQRDKRLLQRAGVDLIFAPEMKTIYPFGLDGATSVTVPALTAELCGLYRPGHFDGVTTVVSRLFSLVQPDIAVFGQKDYQQQMVIRRMVTDLSLPIRVVTGPTRRETDGLAMSSRNQYLTDDERKIAPRLFGVISEVASALENGHREFQALEEEALAKLSESGFKPEYVSIRRAESLGAPDRDCDELVVLASAWLGKARLIDNLVVHI